jgi:trigger factor
MADESPQAGQGEPEPQAAAAQAETAPPEELEEPSYTASVEETGPCTRTVKIEVAQERVQDEVEKSYEELRKTVFVKGFRPGHIPRHVLERRFGEQVRDSVKQSLVDETFEKVVEKHTLRLAMPAEIKHGEIPLEAGKPLAFEVKVEVVPQFTIDNYKGLTVERPRVEVSPEQVDRAVEGFRLRHGDYRKVEEGEAGERDIPVCHAAALHDGQEVWRGTDLGAVLTADTLGGMHVPGLKDALLGVKIGETKTFRVTLPADFKVEEHRGKEVDLEVTIDELRRFEAPEATVEWARSLRFDSLEDLRDELQDELRRQAEQDADDAVQERIAEQLLHLTDFDVPEGMVDRIVARTKDRQRVSLLYRGVPREEIDKAVERFDKQTRENSVRQCKLYFIYERLAELEKLFVTEDELTQRIQAIALNYRRRPEEVYNELETQGRLSSLRQQMREEKVRDFLVQHANIAEAAAAAPAAAAKPSDDSGT